jgi:tetratricopeptide (TPR) repeat protein
MLKSGMIEKFRRWDEAQKAYERGLQLDGDNAAVLKNNLAWVLAEHGGNIDVALKLVQEATEKLYDNPQVTDTIGWVYYKKALGLLEAVGRQGPEEPGVSVSVRNGGMEARKSR